MAYLWDMPVFTKIGALRLINPKLWKEQIRQAMHDADGRVGDAADKLGVSPRQLFRWLSSLPEIPRVENGTRRNEKQPRVKKEVVSAPVTIRRRRKTS